MNHFKYMGIQTGQYDQIIRLLDFINNKNNNYCLTNKIDGSSSVFLHNHNYLGVTDKHRFKRGVVCSTKDDIKKIFHHLPNLSGSLCDLLQVVGEIVPPGCIFQGDLLYTPTEPPKVVDAGVLSCTPNVHTYEIVTPRPIGVAIHSMMVTLNGNMLKVPYNLIKESKNVYVPNVDVHLPSYTTVRIPSIINELKKYEKWYVLSEDLKTYMIKYLLNQVRQRSWNASASDLSSYIDAEIDSHINTLVMKYAIDKAKEKKYAMLADIRKNREYIDMHIKLHDDLQDITEKVVPYSHSDPSFIGALEGLVVNIKNPTHSFSPYVKLVPTASQHSLLTRTARC